MARAYEEVVEFIAAGTTPGKVIAFRPSDAARERVGALLEGNRQGTLSADEAAELEHFVQVEHLMRLAKARARKMLREEAAAQAWQ